MNWKIMLFFKILLLILVPQWGIKMRSDTSVQISPKEYLHHNPNVSGSVNTKAPPLPVNINTDLPHFLAFIYGTEVTESLVSLSFNHQLDGDPSECTIELSNNLDQWVITPRNLGLDIITGDSRQASPG